MNRYLRTLVLGHWVALVLAGSVQAQAPRAGAAERERGIFNRMGARREERLNRNAPAPQNPPAPGNAAANRFRGSNLAAENAAAARGGQPADRNAPRAPGAPGTINPATANAARSAAGNQYASGYAPNGVDPASATADRTGRELPPNALPPSDSARPLPPNRLPYNGPGVLIRLPERLRGEVNYLVDDIEHLVVHSGEAQHLRIKGRYEIRFSRGVQPDGQSLGEARYTVSEGVYRFDVADQGWELYREGEAADVALAVREAEQRRPGQFLDQDDLSPASQTSEEPMPAKREAPLPSPAAGNAASEDTLPAPRSILERT